ncbi:MAG: nucleoside hydrolase [Hungatella sp.]|nr:nucleoside hydrolase [Hungatella sp.]
MDQDIRLLERLKRPEGRVDVVLDTDTYNEIDDQYALAYLLKSEDKLNVKGIYAAPFHNSKSNGPADGMEKSYKEIKHILKLMGREELGAVTRRGSTEYLPDEFTWVVSDAAKDLAERAMEYTSEHPLYVIAIGAITNVASAILMNPQIEDRIVLIWLGGHALDWPDNREFNLYQDVAGARVVFGRPIAMVHLPCKGVVSAFTVSGPELEAYLRGKNPLCDYLTDVTEAEAAAWGARIGWTRPIWDVTAVAWLLCGEFMKDRIEHAPMPEYDDRYSCLRDSHLYRYVYYINRDRLLEDLIQKLTR